jgi:hypothetical protein
LVLNGSLDSPERQDTNCRNLGPHHVVRVLGGCNFVTGHVVGRLSNSLLGYNHQTAANPPHRLRPRIIGHVSGDSSRHTRHWYGQTHCCYRLLAWWYDALHDCHRSRHRVRGTILTFRSTRRRGPVRSFVPSGPPRRAASIGCGGRLGRNCRVVASSQLPVTASGPRLGQRVGIIDTSPKRTPVSTASASSMVQWVMPGAVTSTLVAPSTKAPRRYQVFVS